MVKENTLTLISFKEKQAKEVLSLLGLTTKKRGPLEFVSDKKGSIIRCSVCNKEITLDNIGNISKGSNNFYCKDPACFAQYLVQKKL